MEFDSLDDKSHLQSIIIEVSESNYSYFRFATLTYIFYNYKQWFAISNNYPVSMSLFCLSHSFVDSLYFCSNWDRS